MTSFCFDKMTILPATSKPSNGGNKMLTGLFIGTFTLSIAYNIYTLAITRSSVNYNESDAERVQLSSELTPFGTPFSFQYSTS